MYKDEIIDAHFHLWDLDHGDYPWLKGEETEFESLIGNIKKIQKNFLVPDYEALVKPFHVTKGVHVEANADIKKALYETEWLQKIADSHGFPHAIVAQADLTDPDIENVLKDHCQFPNVRGIRQTLFRQPGSSGRDLLTDPHFHRGIKALSRQLLSFDVSVFGHQIPDVAKLAKEYDDVMFVLDHLGWPLDVSDQGLEKWMSDLSLLSDCENVYLKLSGIGMIFKNYENKNIERFLHGGIRVFGADRCLFAGNFPPDSLFMSYGEIIDLFRKTLALYDLEDQRKIFYENAKQFYEL